MFRKRTINIDCKSLKNDVLSKCGTKGWPTDGEVLQRATHVRTEVEPPVETIILSINSNNKPLLKKIKRSIQ